jgi:hypothetical protein
MRKRSLLFTLGASLAAATLAVGTALADPTTSPVPDKTPQVQVGTGAQTLEGFFDDLCNNVLNPPNNTCAFYDIEPPGSTITTRPSPPHSCTFTRPNGTRDGENALINHPDCVNWGAGVTDSDKASFPSLTYIPVAKDALTYAVRSDGNVPRDLDIPTLKRIYQCDPALTSPRPGGLPPLFHPLIGVQGAGNRTLWLQTLGITDGADLTTRFPCITQGFPANDGTVLQDGNELITYSTSTYLSQIAQVDPDRHGQAVLGDIGGIPALNLNNDSTIARDLFDIVRTSDTTNGSPVQSMFVGPTSQVCSQSNVIKRHGFNTISNCGALGNTN